MIRPGCGSYGFVGEAVAALAGLALIGLGTVTMLGGLVVVWLGWQTLP